MKRVLSMVLAVLMLCALMVPASAAKLRAFQDVSRDSWYAGNVYALVQEGIINGKSEKTFDPAGNLTRAELMKMLACVAMSQEELAAYQKSGSFSDVKANHWFAPYVNWAAKNEITNGYNDGTFRPNRPVTRAEAASLVVRFAKTTGASDLNTINAKAKFSDDKKIAGWAKENIYICQQAGLFGGYPDGSFQGGNNILRSEAAAVICRLLSIQPLEKDQLPEPDAQKPAKQTGDTFRKTVAGYSVTGVEFKGYRPGVILAGDRFYQTESDTSMAERSGAQIVCNGPFFNNQGDLTTYISAVVDGKALRIDNSHYPYQSFLVFDDKGNASMQFLKILQTVTLLRDGEVKDQYEEVGCNYAFGDDDGSRMIFTSVFGDKIPGKVKCAIVCNGDGMVTKVFDSSTAQGVTIPKDGFVLCQRQRRDRDSEYKWDNFFSTCKKGDKIEVTVSYEGSKAENIQTAFSGGATVVKNGKAYGNADTYAQEGVTEYAAYATSTPRTGIGVKKDGTVVIAIATCTFRGLGDVMAGLGCETAMVLDGGNSTALYVSGNSVYSAGRLLSHMLTFSK